MDNKTHVDSKPSSKSPGNIKDETSSLIQHKTDIKTDEIIKGSSRFIYASSIWEELQIMTGIAVRIGLSLSFEMAPNYIAIMFLGHLPNTSVILSGCGLAKTFSNMFAVGISWGMTSGLYTLVPQALGANKPTLLAIYFQRAVVVNAIIMVPLTIVQFFGGQIVCFILPTTCRDIPIDIITNYCRVLISYLWTMVLLSICQRVAQSLKYNTELLIAVLIPALLTVPLMYLFVYVFDCGYLGTAYVICLCNIISFLLSVYTLIYHGYGFIFKPLPFHIVFTQDGLWEYFALSFPGCFQTSLRWIIREMMVILSGFVYNPSLAISVTVVTSSVSQMTSLSGGGINRALNIRIGKYIGYGSVKMAKKSMFVGNVLTGIFIAFVLLIYAIFRKQLPFIWTHDEDVVPIVENLIFILMVRTSIFRIYGVLCGIYRGLGYQKISAFVQAPVDCLIAFPLACILLFGLGYKKYTEISVIIIWGCAAGGYVMGSAIILLLLIFYVDWNGAVHQSKMRIKQTMKTYGAVSAGNNNI